jgi:hypothetical protein
LPRWSGIRRERQREEGHMQAPEEAQRGGGHREEARGGGRGGVNDDQLSKLRTRSKLLAKMNKLEDRAAMRTSAAGGDRRPDTATA